MEIKIVLRGFSYIAIFHSLSTFPKFFFGFKKPNLYDITISSRQLDMSSQVCFVEPRLIGFLFCFSLLVPIRDVEAVLGGRAELPCDILPEDAHDDVYLVLWFKENATKPMYR